eukprot:scaffold2783_cov20-Tisochrysis_lutea.AAC.1
MHPPAPYGLKKMCICLRAHPPASCAAARRSHAGPHWHPGCTARMTAGAGASVHNNSRAEAGDDE